MTAATTERVCLDCGIDVQRIGETFMLHDKLWLGIVPGGRGNLCVECVERRLGRPLAARDFNGQSFGWSRRSERLTDRLNRREGPCRPRGEQR